MRLLRREYAIVVPMQQFSERLVGSALPALRTVVVNCVIARSRPWMGTTEESVRPVRTHYSIPFLSCYFDTLPIRLTTLRQFGPGDQMSRKPHVSQRTTALPSTGPTFASCDTAIGIIVGWRRCSTMPPSGNWSRSASGTGWRFSPWQRPGSPGQPGRQPQGGRTLLSSPPSGNGASLTCCEAPTSLSPNGAGAKEFGFAGGTGCERVQEAVDVHLGLRLRRLRRGRVRQPGCRAGSKWMSSARQVLGRRSR